jgi:hypothetical protein
MVYLKANHPHPVNALKEYDPWVRSVLDSKEEDPLVDILMGRDFLVKEES